MPAPTSPSEWLGHLEPRLRERRRRLDRLDLYHDGGNLLEIVRRDYLDVFEGLMPPPRTNLCAVAVAALVERLMIDTFAVYDGDAPEGDTGGGLAVQVNDEVTRQAARVWHESDLDVWSHVLHTETSTRGYGYVSLWPTDDGNPVIAVESAHEVITSQSPRPPFETAAALKVTRDDWTGGDVAEVWLPEGVWRFRRPGLGSYSGVPINGLGTDAGERGLILPSSVTFGSRAAGWIEYPYDDERGNAIAAPRSWARRGWVPIVAFPNSLRTAREPASDITPLMPLQDSADKLLADLMIAASYGAVPMRYATGVKLGKPTRDASGRVYFVDEDGNPVEPFDTRGDRVWVSPDPSSKMGTLQGATLDGFVQGMQAIERQARAITRVPYHYFDMGGTSGTAGELLKALEGPLERRADPIRRARGVPWRRVMRLALTLLDEALADRQIRVRWADTETRSEAQSADAASKLATIGVPLATTLEQVLGWPADVITEALAIRERDQISADAALAAITGAGVAAPGSLVTPGQPPPQLVGPDGNPIASDGG